MNPSKRQYILPPKTLTLNDLEFPDFNAIQVKYLEDLKFIYRQDRLNLDPEEVTSKFLKKQYTWLKGCEDILDYLLACIISKEVGERNERLGGTPFDLEREVENLKNPNSPNVEGHDQLL